MRILYILTIAGVISCSLLWLGVFGKLQRKAAAVCAALLMACAGTLLALAVLPGNSFYGHVLTHKETTRKIIALTFDDGPYPPYTQQLLEVLRQKQVKATFFMVGENAAKHPQIVKMVLADGHQIALHAGKHQDLLKLDPEALNNNITSGKTVLEAITKMKITAMRPPHGFKDWQVVKAINAAGLQIVNWSVIPRDWTNPGADTIASRVLRDASPGAIVLLHDGDSPKMTAPRQQTIEATAKIIDELRKQGYEFVTVDELKKL